MDYKITKLNQLQIYDFLLETDQSFIPKPISTRVNLKDYALKLASHATFFVCIKKEKLIGVIACYLNDKTKKKAFVSLISVLPKYQGKGIGQKLTKLCDEEAMKLGFAEIETEIHIKNKPSIAMYKKGGYSLNRRANNSLFLCKRLIEYNMGEKIPLVSICMITYNHESYIRKAIEGVLIQKTTFPIQLVIGEDCSSDNTRNICKEYLQKNQDIIVLLERESNLGMQENASATLNACIGKYIAMCEGDDYWTDPLKLQKQVDFLEKNSEYTGCCHPTKVVNSQSKTLSTDRYIGNRVFSFTDISKGNFIRTCSFLFNKNILTDDFFKLIKNIHIGDYPLFMQTASKGKIKSLNQVMSAYRVTDSGAWSGNNNNHKFYNNYLMIQEFEEYFKILVNEEIKANFHSQKIWAIKNWLEIKINSKSPQQDYSILRNVDKNIIIEVMSNELNNYSDLLKSRKLKLLKNTLKIKDWLLTKFYLKH